MANWLAAHWIESVAVALIAMNLRKSISNGERISKVEARVTAIDKAVNNVKDSEKTLREMVYELWKGDR